MLLLTTGEKIKKKPAASGPSSSRAPLEVACGLRRPPFERRACASCRPQGGAACAPAGWRTEMRARGPDGSRMRSPQLAGARTTSSVDGWASMALRSHVVEAAGVRSTSFRQHSERRRACLFAWADGPRAGDPCSPSCRRLPGRFQGFPAGAAEAHGRSVFKVVAT